MIRITAVFLALAALAGCAQRGPAGLNLDTSVTAVSQSSRVRFVVVHYTSTDDVLSGDLLVQG